MASMAGMGYTQEIPQEVKTFLENYLKNATERSNAEKGLDFARRSDPSNEWIKTLQVKDLSVGKVLEAYKFKRIDFTAYPDTVPFSEIIEPSGHWHVLIMGQNKPLYELTLHNSNGILKYVGRGSIGSTKEKIWDPLLKTYPESTGINPVLVSTRGGGFLLYHGDCFLYFKQKGPRKVYYIRTSGPETGSLSKLFSSSMGTLDDSRKYVEFRKKQELNKKENHSNEHINVNAAVKEIESGSTGFLVQPLPPDTGGKR
jgi:hypothetical protein